MIVETESMQHTLRIITLLTTSPARPGLSEAVLGLLKGSPLMVDRQINLTHSRGLYTTMRFSTIRSSARSIEPDESYLPCHQDPQHGLHVSRNKLPRLDAGRIAVRLQHFRETTNQEQGINVGLNFYKALCKTTIPDKRNK